MNYKGFKYQLYKVADNQYFLSLQNGNMFEIRTYVKRVIYEKIDKNPPNKKYKILLADLPKPAQRYIFGLIKQNKRTFDILQQKKKGMFKKWF